MMIATQPFKIIYFGSPEFAVPALAQLYEQPTLAQIVCVVSQPDKPQGRGKQMAPCPVKQLAMQRGLKTFTPHTLKTADVQEELRQYGADFFIVAAYGKILPQAVLDLPTYGCLNLHASCLPLYRGASPIHQAILNGDTHTGLALMKMEAALDTGPVYQILTCPIQNIDTTASLTQTLAYLGAQVLIEQLAPIASGRCQAKPQDHTQATYTQKIKKEDGLINWQLSVSAIDRHIRAYYPWPVSYTFLNKKRIQIIQARPDTDIHTKKTEQKNLDTPAPGTLYRRDSRCLLVACAQGQYLEIERLKPEGKKEMSAQDFILGYWQDKNQILQFTNQP